MTDITNPQENDDLENSDSSDDLLLDPLDDSAIDDSLEGDEEAFLDFDENDFDDDFDDDFEEAVEGEYEVEDDEFRSNVPEFNPDGSVIKKDIEEEKEEKEKK